MESIELRNKLIEQFNTVIQDDSKLAILDGFFDAIINSNDASVVSEDHYKTVEERRRKSLNNETNGSSWDNVRMQLKKKYDL